MASIQSNITQTNLSADLSANNVIISDVTVTSDNTQVDIKSEIINLIIQFYAHDDYFLTIANEFLTKYDQYYSNIKYDMAYLKSLMKNKVMRGTTDE